MSTLTIGKVARQAEVPINTIRFYEREGLIPPPARRPSGYRDYPADTVKRLRFIRRAKDLGFTLGEITELLQLTERSQHDMAGMKRAAEAKLALVEAKLAELQRMREALNTMVTACPGHGEMADCPIVNALTQDAHL
jgi:MerR family copper efflux transcriptional regulator